MVAAFLGLGYTKNIMITRRRNYGRNRRKIVLYVS